jgi:DNA-binding response OmpR family regulator
MAEEAGGEGMSRREIDDLRGTENQRGANSRILIVEDNAQISDIIAEGLRCEGFRCTQAYSGSEAMLHLAQTGYELIVLDLMLPGLSGEALISRLRGELRSSVPVIVLSARDQLDHKLELFARGADDYVTKPFELAELIARIHAQLKRAGLASETEPAYRHKQLLLDSRTYQATVKGHPLQLTRQEYRILELLLKNPSRVFTKQDLYTLAWDEPYMGEDKTITVHISNIRNKIKAHCEQSYIETIWGIGFRLSRAEP